jgi:AraC family transcriptional regulator of adaptative response/methylated-DNA-[protein]-cysteine methyltransferase
MGRTMSYSELARRVGKPGAARAVGNAVGKNPFAPAVPCHRVIRSDGSIGGYAFGVAKKRKLLAREKEKSSR